MSGLNARIAEQQLLMEADVDALLAGYGYSHPDEPPTSLNDVDELLARYGIGNSEITPE